ncbi:hypothetical protein C3L33_10465, partial [Rhododendron williamsianum]
MSIPKNPGLLEEGEEEESYGMVESMDPELYRATTEGDILEFIKAMEHGTLDRHYQSSAGCVQLGPQKNTVLHIATSCGHYEIVKLLCKGLAILCDSLLVPLLINCDLREGALELENEERNTALHEALGHRHQKVARILIDRNRSAWYSVNKEGKSVLYLAAEAVFVGLVKLLMENPAGICKVLKHQTPLGFLEGVKFLLSNFCAAAYQRDIYGLFPIHTASSEGHVDIIQGMLQHCPDSRELLTLQGQNIFHVAAKSGNGKAVSSMLKIAELEKLLNEKDDEGNMPLHVATICGHPRIVRALIWDERVDLELVNKGIISEGIPSIYKYAEDITNARNT